MKVFGDSVLNLGSSGIWNYGGSGSDLSVHFFEGLHFLTPALLGDTNQFITLLVLTRKRRKGVGVEGILGFRIDRKFADNLIFAKFNQVFGREFGAKFFAKDIGVLVANNKGKD